ncbi:hypothetical protein [Bradyrhizobium sp. SRS-191]|uniref:hypothetical protein n=1 Tax=Bradyrhizobium sp. SRS-191 TaxID=2962606 RepID=UPI0027B89DF6|nr:hypothetical protein [Bradyrhizobium sp. SRS-191]
MSRMHAVRFATLLCLVTCTGAQAERPAFAVVDRPSQDGRCIDDPGRGDLDRSEAACLAQLSAFAQRSGSSLKLTFRNGRTRIYRNQDARCAEGDIKTCVKFQLTGYFPEHELILIECGRLEGVDWILVRADIGDEIGIVAPPHYSPEKRWLVSVVARRSSSGPPEGIDIIPTKRDRMLKDWHYRTPEDSKWRYEFERWDGEDQIVLSAKPTEDTAMPRLVAIHRKKSEWLFK